MSTKNDYESRLSEVEAVTIEGIKVFSMPVNVFITEAEKLYETAKKDWIELKNREGNQPIIDELRVRINVLREAETRWLGMLDKNTSTGREKKAGNLTKEMERQLSLVERESTDKKAVRALRDKAYIYLKNAVDEMRLYGRIVFAEDAKRRRAYVSSYFQNANKKGKSGKRLTDAELRAVMQEVEEIRKVKIAEIKAAEAELAD